MRKLGSITIAAAVGLALAVGAGAASPQTAAAATAKSNITGASISIVADNVRAVTHPGTVSAAFVAPANDAISIALASAAANINGATVIVSTSSTNPAAVNAVVTQKEIKTLTFVGTPTDFPASYRSAIDPQVTSKKIALNVDPFERSKLLVAPGTTAFVIAQSSNVSAMEAALSYSAATDSALLALSGNQAAGPLRSYLTPIADPKVALSGDPAVLDQLDPDDSDHYVELLLDSPAAINSSYDNIMQLHVDRKSRSATKVVVAPADDLASFALATIVGQRQSAITLPAGKKASLTTNSAAHYYIGLLASETTSLTLVGTATTAANLTSVAAPTTITRSADPAWTVTNTTLGTGTYTVTFNARAGATKYRALNWDGSVITTSSTTSVTITGTPDYFTLVALNASGTEIARLYYRSNLYGSASDRATAITGTIQNGTANLRVLGAPNVPRKIVRSETNPYAGLGDEPIQPRAIAITCRTSFTDSGLNPQHEYSYEVVNLTLKTGTGCGLTAAAPIAGIGLPVGGLALPLTEDPWATSGNGARRTEDVTKPRQGTSEQESILPRPGQTWTDAARQQLQYNVAHPDTQIQARSSDEAGNSEQRSNELSAATAIGSQFVFSYQAYIPEKYVLGPGYSGDPSKPFIVFNGSDRAWWDVNSVGTKFDIRGYVGDSQVFWTKHMAETTRAHCSLAFPRSGFNCTVVGHATAPLSELSASSVIAPALTRLTFEAHAGNPMEPFAQDIDGQMIATLDTRSWRLVGKHDKMPVHQFWWSPIYGDGHLVYSSANYYSLHCLFPNVPGCTARINQSF
ncbi:hypothetical protein [Microbacterium sp. NPDC087591]|uniref:hypothetical protein n=1 Tax=Microbacterium sp. NPDC087591 TaxID=3364192 RepID=UPI0037F19FA0